MPWESEEDKPKPGRDWAKYMWYGVAALMMLGVAAMFVPWQNRGGGVTRARVSHILVKLEGLDGPGRAAAIKRMQDIRQQIKNGANFAKVAAEHSDDTQSAAKGGDLGWVQPGELSDALDEYIWKAPLNQVSDIFISETGMHIVIIYDREISKAEQYEMELKERVLKGETAADTPKK
jgi:parvulin-like peptidyl-prolyl isomerase